MHIEIPDGVLPIWLWLIGYLITAILLFIFLPKLKKDYKKVPLIGMLSAIVLLIMSVPLGLPTHLNLMGLVGVLVGAPWSLIIALTTNIVQASFGHGGLTVIGLNTVLYWLQALLTIMLFRALIRIFKNYFASVCLATFASLLIGFLLLIGIVAASQINPANLLQHERGDENQLSEIEHRADDESAAEIEKEYEHLSYTPISMPIFIILSLPLFFFGALIDSLVTGFIIIFIKKVKPELIATL